MGRNYRLMKAGKLDLEMGRNLVWVLSQMRPVLEAEALTRIEEKLQQLNAYAAQRNGGAVPLMPARLPNYGSN